MVEALEVKEETQIMVSASQECSSSCGHILEAEKYPLWIIIVGTILLFLFLTFIFLVETFVSLFDCRNLSIGCSSKGLWYLARCVRRSSCQISHGCKQELDLSAPALLSRSQRPLFLQIVNYPSVIILLLCQA